MSHSKARTDKTSPRPAPSSPIIASSLPTFGDRLKDLLDETRLAMLGAQLLMGIQYSAAFSPAFERLRFPWRLLDGVALLLILTTVAMLLGTPAFHQIAEAGHATGRILHRASATLGWALLPLAVAIGLDIAIGLSVSLGDSKAATYGAAFVAGALLVWYAMPALSATRGEKEDRMDDNLLSVETRIAQALTELRVIIPGAQALFGFQFMAVLTDSFARLTPTAQLVHLVSLGLVALSVIMLIAPVPYHRIAARGNAEPGVLRYTVAMMLPALGVLTLGMVGDAYVTIRVITQSQIAALIVSGAALLVFVTLLYVLPLMARRQHLSASFT